MWRVENVIGLGWNRDRTGPAPAAGRRGAKTLRGHRELILNYFRAKKQFSSGIVEGLNNRAKLTMRKAYGFRTFRVTEIALYHALGKLSEPHATHRFY
jgi:transposase